jgi:hypothetical protein
MNHEWQYSLTPDEVVQAVAYAKQQTHDAAARGGKHKPRGTNWTEERVVTGFKAEIALAALLGVTYTFWQPSTPTPMWSGFADGNPFT